MTDTSKSAAYSIGTSSSLLQGEVIPDKPIRIQPSREQFRPDIEGMRAIAVGLVILFHAYHEPFTGGFVGVDVFFVISGFLITSLLLKEQERSGRISISVFYARRVRRILPASTLVVLVTLFATYGWLGFIAGNNVANDAKWTEIFAANIHFGLIRTDYFGAQLPPSPLQHMWSLGVEEQFYLVWPGVFLVLVLLARGAQHRKALAGALSSIIAASLIWSVIQTVVNQTWAYFSPLARAWELALGALVAVLAPTIARLRHAWAPQALAFAGLVGIALAAVLFTSDTRYPGSAVALPVVGSCSIDRRRLRQPTNDRWSRPVGAANAVGRRAVLLHVSLALATSYYPRPVRNQGTRRISEYGLGAAHRGGVSNHLSACGESVPASQTIGVSHRFEFGGRSNPNGRNNLHSRSGKSHCTTDPGIFSPKDIRRADGLNHRGVK